MKTRRAGVEACPALGRSRAGDGSLEKGDTMPREQAVHPAVVDAMADLADRLGAHALRLGRAGHDPDLVEDVKIAGDVVNQLTMLAGHDRLSPNVLRVLGRKLVRRTGRVISITPSPAMLEAVRQARRLP